MVGADGFGKKTRVLDAAQTGGPEIEAIRGLWAALQNEALERVGAEDRVDHRSPEAQREVAEERGDLVAAEELDRAPEVKLGPAVNAMERRAAREAYGAARDEGQDRVSAGLAALRAALGKQRDGPEVGESVGDRLRRMLAREQERGGGEAPEPEKDVRARLDAALGRDRAGGAEKGRDADATGVDREAPRREAEQQARPPRDRRRQRDDDRER